MKAFLIILWVLSMFDVSVNDKPIPIHTISAILGLVLFCVNF